MNTAMPVGVLLVASVVWGVSWWPLKQLNALGIEGIPLTLGAFGAITAILLPMLIAQRRHWAGAGHVLLAIGVLGGYANLAFTSAMIYGEVVRVMVLFYLLPVWGVLGGRLFLGERIDAARGVAVALALTGALLILGGFEAFKGEIAWTDLLALSCGIAYAGNNLLFRAQQSLPVRHKVTAMLGGCFAIAALLMLGQVQAWPTVPVQNWLWVVGYGLGWILLATVATQWAVTHLEAGRASILIIMELVTAVLTAMWFGGERMNGLEMFGAVLILAAAVIEARGWGAAAPAPARAPE
jgi:drug/metabolite transporter (DMT)-like permease